MWNGSTDKPREGARITMDGGVGHGATLIAVSGRVGIEEANDLQGRFDEVIRAGRPWIILDLKDVDFICSAGMGTLLSGVGEARRAGGEVIFVEISRKARTVFEFLDIWDYVTTTADVPTALEMVRGGKKLHYRQLGDVASPAVVAEEIRFKLQEGARLSKAGKLKDALACFNAVLKIDKDNVASLTWKANALERLGQFGEARRLYQRVDEVARGDPKLLAYARERLERLNAKLGVGPTSPLLAALRTAITESAAGPVDRLPFFETGRSFAADAAAFLECYRTWDEAPPIYTLPGGEYHSTGGGYYLWVGGKGIVLNPGPGFVSRFAAAGRRLADVDVVIVTRPHYMYHADAETLADAVTAYNAASDVPKDVTLFFPARVTQHFGKGLKGNADAAPSTIPLDVGGVYKLGSATLEVKTPRERDDLSSGFGVTVADGSTHLAYIPALEEVDLNAAAARFRNSRGKVVIADGWGVFTGGDARADQGQVGEAGIFARFLAEIRPAVALLSGVVNARSPVHFAAALHRATGVWCLPIDVGFALNLADVTVKTPGGNLRVNDVRVAEGGGRLEYAAASP